MRPWLRWTGRLALMAVALAASLAGAEWWVRTQRPLHLGIVSSGTIRLSEDPALAYEHVPGFFPHNNFGFRDRHFLPKKSSSYRLAVMGDSITWGMQAEVQQTPSAYLESTLRAHTEDRPIYEAFNFGVMGYNIINEAAQLELKVLPHQPDEVFLLVCLNDWSPNEPEFRACLLQQDAGTVSLLTRLYDPALTGAERALMELHLYRHARRLLAGSKAADATIDTIADPIRSHYEGRDFYGERLAHMADVLEQRNIPFSLVLLPYDPLTRRADLPLYRDRLDELQRACAGHGCSVMDGLAVLGDGSEGPRTFHDDGLHPTAWGNELLGKAMAERVLEGAPP